MDTTTSLTSTTDAWQDILDRLRHDGQDPKTDIEQPNRRVDDQMTKIPGFLNLPEEDQLLLKYSNIKPINIIVEKPKNKEERKFISDVYGETLKSIGKPIPVSRLKYLHLYAPFPIFQNPGGNEPPIGCKGLSVQTWQWLVDNHYCLGPRETHCNTSWEEWKRLFNIPDVTFREELKEICRFIDKSVAKSPPHYQILFGIAYYLFMSALVEFLGKTSLNLYRTASTLYQRKTYGCNSISYFCNPHKCSSQS